MYDNEKINIPDPIESRTLRIGDFAGQIENNPGGLILGTVAEDDQRIILRLVVGTEFFLDVSGKIWELRWIFCGNCLRLFIK